MVSLKGACAFRVLYTVCCILCVVCCIMYCIVCNLSPSPLGTTSRTHTVSGPHIHG